MLAAPEIVCAVAEMVTCTLSNFWPVKVSIEPLLTLNRLFLGGLEPPFPGPHRCGFDPTFDGLGVCEHTSCP